jgi:predicted transposase/invertase (TIGR01784 family)
MRAERAAAKIDRDYEKFARKMAEMKNRLDIALMREAVRHKGIEEGRAEGHAEGLEKGRAEEKLEIARKMKKARLPFNEIMEFTGLPAETIEKI